MFEISTKTDPQHTVPENIKKELCVIVKKVGENFDEESYVDELMSQFGILTRKFKALFAEGTDNLYMQNAFITVSTRYFNSEEGKACLEKIHELTKKFKNKKELIQYSNAFAFFFLGSGIGHFFSSTMPHLLNRDEKFNASIVITAFFLLSALLASAYGESSQNELPLIATEAKKIVADGVNNVVRTVESMSKRIEEFQKTSLQSHESIVTMKEACKNCGSKEAKAGLCRHCGTPST